VVDTEWSQNIYIHGCPFTVTVGDKVMLIEEPAKCLCAVGVKLSLTGEKETLVAGALDGDPRPGDKENTAEVI
jgi:hypothetical protein